MSPVQGHRGELGAGEARRGPVPALRCVRGRTAWEAVLLRGRTAGGHARLAWVLWARLPVCPHRVRACEASGAVLCISTNWCRGARVRGRAPGVWAQLQEPGQGLAQVTWRGHARCPCPPDGDRLWRFPLSAAAGHGPGWEVGQGRALRGPGPDLSAPLPAGYSTSSFLQMLHPECRELPEPNLLPGQLSHGAVGVKEGRVQWISMAFESVSSRWPPGPVLASRVSRGPAPGPDHRGCSWGADTAAKRWGDSPQVTACACRRQASHQAADHSAALSSTEAVPTSLGSVLWPPGWDAAALLGVPDAPLCPSGVRVLGLPQESSGARTSRARTSRLPLSCRGSLDPAQGGRPPCTPAHVHTRTHTRGPAHLTWASAGPVVPSLHLPPRAETRARSGSDPVCSASPWQIPLPRRPQAPP